MAFVRVKRIRGRDYAYLVESRWDAERGTSRQATVKYLGALDKLRLEDVPSKHRTDGVRSFILRHSAASEEHRHRLADRFAGELSRALVEGGRDKVATVAADAEGALGLDALYVDVLTPAMHRVGELWRRGDISISVEHLASNLAAKVVEERNVALRTAAKRRGTVVLCTPTGETHNLAAKVLEGLLLRRGYAVSDITASAPMDSILGFLERRKPDFAFVTLTVAAHLPAAKRLVRAIREGNPRVRVIVGGQGTRGVPPDAFPEGVVPAEDTLETLDRLAQIGS